MTFVWTPCTHFWDVSALKAEPAHTHNVSHCSFQVGLDSLTHLSSPLGRKAFPWQCFYWHFAAPSNICESLIMPCLLCSRYNMPVISGCVLHLSKGFTWCLHEDLYFSMLDWVCTVWPLVEMLVFGIEKYCSTLIYVVFVCVISSHFFRNLMHSEWFQSVFNPHN